ncbi:hypothetical protein B0H16DRAFT_1466308 [Mycena metata]|uniref:Uncharacterized protein n=1 Tax=Mycena metata TaxID=1033252 RepID=A0AAD7IAC1_9AGAR|nr:hypothetical protein B0H16DRAFT_1466308 [Mycena metata]
MINRLLARKGPYMVFVDGHTTQHDGFSATDDFAGLFDSGPLSASQHTAVIINTQTDSDSKKRYLDIDSVRGLPLRLFWLTWDQITWLTDSPAAADNTQVDDNTSQFNYQPPDSWSTYLLSNMTGFQGSSDHFTQDNNASAILSFSGTTVSIFGAVSSDIGSFTVKIDGKTIDSFNASKENYVAQQTLYPRDDLGAGDHTLEVINQPSSSGKSLAIDYALVAALPSANASFTSASTTASASSSATTDAKHLTSMALQGGYIVAAVGAVCLSATLLGLIYRHINQRKAQRETIQRTTDVAAFTNPSGAISLQSVSSPLNQKRRIC